MKKTAIDYETLNRAELTRTKEALIAQCSSIDVTGNRDIDILVAQRKKYNENQLLINRMDAFREYEMNTSFSGIPEDQYPSKDEYDRGSACTEAKCQKTKSDF